MDWDVSQGGVAGLIIETNGTSANGRDTITVRYDTLSPSADEADTVHIQASDGTTTKTVKRTVFKVNLTLSFDGALHDDNALLFPEGTGDTRDEAGFNWIDDDNATRPAAKMETIAEFSPSGIDWQARGISFNFGDDPDGKFSLRLQRRRLAQAMYGPDEGVRVIAQDGDDFTSPRLNDDVDENGEWPYDGAQDAGDAQYPTPGKSDYAIRIDAPGPAGVALAGRRFSYRADFTEVVQWHDEGSWATISIEDEGAWFTNVTGMPPDGEKAGDNNHGVGHNATAIPNQRPEKANVPNQTVEAGQDFRLFLAPVLGNSADGDPDSFVIAEWEQVDDQIAVEYETIGRKLEFTAPEVSADTDLTFRVRWQDGTSNLHHHRPNNTESEWSDDFTITITPSQ